MTSARKRSLNPIDTETKLLALLIDDAKSSNLNLTDRYTSLQLAIIKTEKRIASMLDQGLPTDSAAYRSLVTQQLQLQAFLATLQSFKGTIDTELLQIEKSADLDQHRSKLERSFKARPAKVHSAPATPSMFKGLSKAERIRLMQQ